MLTFEYFEFSMTYIIQTFWGCSEYLLKWAQNKETRLVTSLGWYTETSILLLQYRWLSISEMVK